MRHNRDKVVLVPGGRSSRSEPIPSAQSGEGFAGKGNINCGDLAAPLTAAIRLRASAITGKASAAEALALADQPQVAQSRQAEGGATCFCGRHHILRYPAGFCGRLFLMDIANPVGASAAFASEHENGFNLKQLLDHAFVRLSACP